MDLLLAIVYNETLYKEFLDHNQLANLRKCLNDLYRIVSGQFQDSKDIEDAARKKSHYQLYLVAKDDHLKFDEVLSNEVKLLFLPPKGDKPDEHPVVKEKDLQNKGKKKRRSRK